jgi:oligoendopeptidase F
VLDRAVEDRLRGFAHWQAPRNVENQLSDRSVQAVIDATRGRYDLAPRWYVIKARLLGLP